jgi:hypothetical protein
VFRICRTYSIPLIVTVPAALDARARELVGDTPDVVRFVDAADMLTVAEELLGDAAPEG